MSFLSILSNLSRFKKKNENFEIMERIRIIGKINEIENFEYLGRIEELGHVRAVQIEAHYSF